jgi:hypothetical protein
MWTNLSSIWYCHLVQLIRIQQSNISGSFKHIHHIWTDERASEFNSISIDIHFIHWTYLGKREILFRIQQHHHIRLNRRKKSLFDHCSMFGTFKRVCSTQNWIIYPLILFSNFWLEIFAVYVGKNNGCRRQRNTNSMWQGRVIHQTLYLTWIIRIWAI